jgi:hypothetical protein
MMRTRVLLAMMAMLAILGMLCLGGTDTGALAAATQRPNILTFETMYGVDGPFVGDQNPIRSIPGDELPWVIRRAHGFLKTNGRLTIHVRGLVFKDDPSVPPALRGINDEATFRGLVSCLTEKGDKVVEKNVLTEGFPATKSGNADILAKIKLPQPCVAPIIMVLAGSEDKWFAVTGFEAEEE